MACPFTMSMPSPTARLPANPAAVCLLPSWRQDRCFQAVASEMKPLRDRVPGQGSPIISTCVGSLRASKWTCAVTPRWPRRTSSGNRARPPAMKSASRQRSGILKAIRHGDDIELDFPLKPEEEVEAPAGLLAALGISPGTSARTRSIISWKWTPRPRCAEWLPDFRRLATVPVRGVIVTSKSRRSPIRFLFSRFFALIWSEMRPGDGLCPLLPGRLLAEAAGQDGSWHSRHPARGGVVKVR